MLPLALLSYLEKNSDFPLDIICFWSYYNIKIITYSRYIKKQVSLKTDSQRAADGEIAAVMLEPNGS